MHRKITCDITAFESGFNRMTTINISVILEFPDNMYLYKTMELGKKFILSNLMIDSDSISHTRSEPINE